MTLPDRVFGVLVRTALWLAVVMGATYPSFATTVNGFVTNVSAPTAFDVGTAHIVLTAAARCDTELVQSNIELRHEMRGIVPRFYFGLQEQPVASSVATEPCNAIGLHVGMRVSVTGDASATGSIAATRIFVYRVVEETILHKPLPAETLEGAAILEEQPEIVRTGDGWAGSMWLDGYPMSVTPQTTLLRAPAGADIVYELSALGKARFQSKPATPDQWTSTATGLLRANDDVIYGVARTPTGKLAASRLQIWPNEMSSAEREYWKFLRVVVQLPDYRSRTPGTIQSRYDKTVRIVPDRPVQEWISKLGEDLVPEYQRSLAESDLAKIHFRFYVVQGPEPMLQRSIAITAGPVTLRRPGFDDAAVALPSGLIAVRDSTLARIHDSAQLAAILSFAITSVLQNHIFMVTQSLRHGGDADVDTPEFVLRVLHDEQSLRIGIRQMYLAGYDIREAPFSWAVVEGRPAGNPLSDSAKPGEMDETAPWYTAYAFNYISQYYSDVDYSKLKRGEAEYAEFLEELRKADPEAFARKQ